MKYSKHRVRGEEVLEGLLQLAGGLYPCGARRVVPLEVLPKFHPGNRDFISKINKQKRKRKRTLAKDYTGPYWAQ